MHSLLSIIYLTLPFLYISKKPSNDGLSLTYDEENEFYTFPIKIGSKNQIFNVQIDTTTSETWVPSPKTSFETEKFNIATSKTCKATNMTFEVEDEDGDVRGKAIYDSVKVGQYELDKMGFVLVDEYEVGFKDYPKGKLGLGFKQEHGIDFNFIGLLKEKKLINKKMFSLDPNNKELIIGEKPLEYSGQLYTTCNQSETNDLDDEYRAGWACDLTHIFFGVDTKNKDLDSKMEVDARVMFDSAYPYISIPKRHLNDFRNKFIKPLFNDSCTKVKENDMRYLVCDNEDLVKQASMAFVMEGYAYIIPWNQLFVKNDEGKYESLFRFYKENDNIFGFGAPFFNEYTLVFDMEDAKVGFYGGERIDLKKEWDDYMNDMTPSQQKERTKKLIIAGCLGLLLLVFIIFLCIRARKEAERSKGPVFRESNPDAIY